MEAQRKTALGLWSKAAMLVHGGGVAYSYDPNGNLTAFGGNTLSYDASVMDVTPW